MDSRDPVPANYDRLANEIDFDTIDAYVHIGDGTDELLRYLTRVDGEDNYYAFIHTGNETAACLPPRQIGEAKAQFPGDIVYEIDSSGSITNTIQKILGEGRTIAIPETTPIGLVQALETFTTVNIVDEPDEIWCVKNDREIEILSNIAAGAQYALARAETVLASAEQENGKLQWKDKQVTTDLIRCEIRKALAERGLSDAGNVIVGAGKSCADLHFTGYDTIEPDETVLIDLGPRGKYGYYGDITRTFVPRNPTTWAKNAYAIVSEALDAAFHLLEHGEGITAGDLYQSMSGVIKSNGYETGLHETQDDDIGLYHGTGHGIGVRIHEKPFQTPDSSVTLKAGNVLTIEPGIYDPSQGGVRLEDTVVVRENGFEDFMTYPLEIEPTKRNF